MRFEFIVQKESSESEFTNEAFKFRHLKSSSGRKVELKFRPFLSAGSCMLVCLSLGTQNLGSTFVACNRSVSGGPALSLQLRGFFLFRPLTFLVFLWRVVAVKVGQEYRREGKWVSPELRYRSLPSMEVKKQISKTFSTRSPMSR